MPSAEEEEKTIQKRVAKRHHPNQSRNPTVLGWVTSFCLWQPWKRRESARSKASKGWRRKARSKAEQGCQPALCQPRQTPETGWAALCFCCVILWISSFYGHTPSPSRCVSFSKILITLMNKWQRQTVWAEEDLRVGSMLDSVTCNMQMHSCIHAHFRCKTVVCRNPLLWYGVKKWRFNSLRFVLPMRSATCLMFKLLSTEIYVEFASFF